MTRLLASAFLLATVSLADAGPPAKTPPPKKAQLDVAARPAPLCFELSKDGKSWSKTPDRLCISELEGGRHELRLETGLPRTVVAVFTFDEMSRARCIGCRHDVFSLANSSSSVFDALTVRLEGTIDVKTRAESGSVSIGQTKFHYRRAK